MKSENLLKSDFIIKSMLFILQLLISAYTGVQKFSLRLRRVKMQNVFMSVFTLVGLNMQLFGQTNITGVINTYLPVTSITAGTGTCDVAGSPSFTLSSVSGLSTTAGASGNKVLIIQMMAGSSGAINNGSTYKFSSSYGAVTNYGGAGNYEFAYIATISGSTITFTYPLVNTYDVTGKVQIIPVVIYPSGVNTTGVVTGQAWNGTTGGVLLLEAPSLTLNHNFDMIGKGFSGGVAADKSSACCNTSAIDLAANRFAYYFDETQTGTGCMATRTINYGNDKGEGIFSLIATQRLGRGAFANAGGGGSGHNSGGGGGGNCGAGGKGGYEYASCSQEVADDMGGIGGYSMSNGATAVFMGGGGGAGHGNDGGSTSGGNGGGIIILNVNSINTTIAGVRIDASGLKPAAIANSDGAGGGGAGGAILLSVTSFSGSALNIVADGGNGGDNSSAGTCHANGGGGGGGYLKTSASIPIAGVSLSANGGAKGVFTIAASQTTCGAYGSVDGTSCTPSSGLVLNQQICNTLGVEFLNFYAKKINGNNVQLYWTTSEEKENDYFEILRSSDGLNWEIIQKIPGANTPSFYSTLDKNMEPGNYYYKIRQTDFDGKFSYSKILYVKDVSQLISIYPNPINFHQEIKIRSSCAITHISIFDVLGQEVYSGSYNSQEVTISLNRAGVYLVKILSESGEVYSSKIIQK